MQKHKNIFFLRFFFKKTKINLFFLTVLPLFALSSHCTQRGGGFAMAGVSQRFGRATHLKISTKVRAGIHPRSRKTARYRQFIFFVILFLFHSSGMINSGAINAVATENKFGRLTTTRLCPCILIKTPSTPSNAPPIILIFVPAFRRTSSLDK